MIEKLIEQTEAALELAERRRGETLNRHAQELLAVDIEIDRVTRALSALRADYRRRNRRTKPRTPEKQAGPAAIRTVADCLRQGPVTQKQIVLDTGLNEGTVSYALAALRERGVIEETGRKIENSRELRFATGGRGLVRSLYGKAREAGKARVSA